MQDTMGQALEWLLCLAPIAVLFIGITVARVKVPAAAGAGKDTGDGAHMASMLHLPGRHRNITVPSCPSNGEQA